MNLSNVPLSIDCVNALSKGLNFCIYNKLNELQFYIGLQKAQRKRNLYRIHIDKPGKGGFEEHSWDNPVYIRPLRFSVSNNFSNDDRVAFINLCDLMGIQHCRIEE